MILNEGQRLTDMQQVIRMYIAMKTTQVLRGTITNDDDDNDDDDDVQPNENANVGSIGIDLCYK